ncbi:MAG: YjgN family protein [Rhizobiaceae bacterium]
MNDMSATPVAAKSTHRMSFTGSGKEYFGIWIVNILLTIVTLGIYSAWAKVRRNRYFYGNTKLIDRGFDYHAKPMQILKGRIITIVILGAYNLLLNFYPIAGLVFAVGLLFALPWLITSGLRFNARVTSYANVRFGFDGKYWGAAKAFLLGPILSSFTLGLLTPVASKWAAKYVFNNLRYGGKRFETQPSLGAIYKAWLIPAGITIVGLGILALTVYLNRTGLDTMLSESDFTNSDEPPVAFVAVIYIITIALFLVYALAGIFYRAAVRNIVLDATQLEGGHQLGSDLPRLGYVWIVVSNFFATIFTLGLLRPWAAVRLARYEAEHTTVAVNGEVGAVFSEIKSSETALGGEFMDVEGIDVGF